MDAYKLGIKGDNHVDFHGDDDDDDDNDSILSSEVSSTISSDDESDEANSSSAGTSPEVAGGALNDMSDLLQQLPFKRGLSKHFQGKSQSFTSLANVSCLEDLVKPEHPYNKKLKSCKSYVGLSRAVPPPPRSASSSRLFSKKSSSRVGASCSSLSVRRNGSFLGMSSGASGGSRPPTHPPHRNGTGGASFSNQTPLFV